MVYGLQGFDNTSHIIAVSGVEELILGPLKSDYYCFIIIIIPVALQPNAGHSLLIHEVSRLHTMTHHGQQDSSGQVISTSQRPPPDNTQHSQQTSKPPVRFKATISAGKWL